MTPNGQRAAGLLGSYFRDYLLHEGLLTGDTETDLSRSYFRANSIQRSFVTATKFGEGLIPGAAVPVHAYRIADPNTGTAAEPDPVFDPVAAKVVTIDPARAATEAQGILGDGTALTSAYSGELSLVRGLLYPPGTQPTPGAAQGSVDPTSQPMTLTAYPQANYAGTSIDSGGLAATNAATDPFVMQYADGFALEDVAWGRLSLETLSQLTRLSVLEFNIAMQQPYVSRAQSSNAASHVLHTMNQVVFGGQPPGPDHGFGRAPDFPPAEWWNVTPSIGRDGWHNDQDVLRGAFGDAQSRIFVITSSDVYVVGLAGLLNLHWTLPGYQPDFCPPGGALVFELRQSNESQEYFVRAYFTAQTFDQLRNLTPLTQEEPPATMQLTIPGGRRSAANLDVSFDSFANLLTEAIDQRYVQPFWNEVPPGVLDNVPLN